MACTLKVETRLCLPVVKWASAGGVASSHAIKRASSGLTETDVFKEKTAVIPAVHGCDTADQVGAVCDRYPSGRACRIAGRANLFNRDIRRSFDADAVRVAAA